MSDISRTIELLSAPGKGIMACDESPRSMGRRFEAAGVAVSAEARRQYFSMLFGAERLEDSVAGVILYDDLLDEGEENARLLSELKDRGIMIGVRADQGAVPMPGYPDRGLTAGIDSLAQRMDNYAANGTAIRQMAGGIGCGRQTRKGSDGAGQCNDVGPLCANGAGQ